MGTEKPRKAGQGADHFSRPAAFSVCLCTSWRPWIRKAWEASFCYPWPTVGAEEALLLLLLLCYSWLSVSFLKDLEGYLQEGKTRAQQTLMWNTGRERLYLSPEKSGNSAPQSIAPSSTHCQLSNHQARHSSPKFTKL